MPDLAARGRLAVAAAADFMAAVATEGIIPAAPAAVALAGAGTGRPVLPITAVAVVAGVVRPRLPGAAAGPAGRRIFRRHWRLRRGWRRWLLLGRWRRWWLQWRW